MDRNQEKKKSRMSLKQILLGDLLTSRQFTRWMPVAGLLAFLGLIMISNRFHGEKVIRKMVILQDSVKNLRFESATIDAELMKLSRYSTVLRESEKRGLGLESPVEPPKKIKIDK